jgi:phosphate transport system protein
MGDLAGNVSERVVELDSTSLLPVRASLVQMGHVVSDMLHEALDAFIDGDAARAERVIQRDSVVDATYAKIFPELLGHMMEDPKSVATAQKLQSIAKSAAKTNGTRARSAEAPPAEGRERAGPGLRLLHPQVELTA